MKFLEENFGEKYLHDWGQAKIIQIRHYQQVHQRKQMRNLTVKIKNFGLLKDIVKKMKRQATDGAKILANYVPNKILYPEYIKDPQNSTVRK